MAASNRLLCALLLFFLLGCSLFAETATTPNGKHAKNGMDEMGNRNDNHNDNPGDQTIIQTANEVMGKDGSFVKGVSSAVSKQSNGSHLKDLEPLERLYRLLGDYLMCRYHSRPNCESEIGEKNVQGLKDHLPPPSDWHNDESKNNILHDRLDKVYEFGDSRRRNEDRQGLTFPWQRSDRFQQKISPNGLLSGFKGPIGSPLRGNAGGNFELGGHPPMRYPGGGPMDMHWGNAPFMANPAPQPLMDNHRDDRREKKSGDSWVGSPQLNKDYQAPSMMQPWPRNTQDGNGMFPGAMNDVESSMMPIPFGANIFRY